MENKKFILHIYARERKLDNKTMYFFSYRNPQTNEKFDVKFTKSAGLIPNLVRERGFYKIEGTLQNFSLSVYESEKYGMSGCIWVRSFDAACRDLAIARDTEYEEVLAKQNRDLFETHII